MVLSGTWYGPMTGFCECRNEPSCFIEGVELSECLSEYQIFCKNAEARSSSSPVYFEATCVPNVNVNTVFHVIQSF